jgi:hypothetical protein
MNFELSLTWLAFEFQIFLSLFLSPLLLIFVHFLNETTLATASSLSFHHFQLSTFNRLLLQAQANNRASGSNKQLAYDSSLAGR